MSDTPELRELVRQVAADHPHADPREIARHVAKLTPADTVMSFYADALVPIVREVLIGQRTTALSAALSPSKPDAPAKSAKLAQRRDWWAEMLGSRVHTDDGWKVLGDCTSDDLRYCIRERQTDIARVQAQIVHFETLLGLMDAHHVAYVRELPRGAAQ